MAAPEEPVRQTESPVRPEAAPPVSEPAPAPAPAPVAASDAGSAESFSRVGGRGGPKQSHAGANVFASSWGFGSEHGDKDVSSADRFTSANRQMMASGHSGGAATAAPTRGRGAARQAWGESAPEPAASKPQPKIKYPKDE